VTADGQAYVAGETAAGFGMGGAFPTTSGAYDTSPSGSSDAFVTHVSAAGALLYSTLLGGSSTDTATAIALDSAGEAVTAGTTASTDFPTAQALAGSGFIGNSAFLT